MSLLSGAGLPVGFLTCYLVSVFLLGNIFIMRLLSGADLPVGFLNFYLGVSFPAGKAFS